MLSALETRLAQHLHLQADQVYPAPGAWSILKSRMSRRERGRDQTGLRSISNLFHFESKGTRRLALALAIIIVFLLVAPPAWTLAARISDWVGDWFHFRTPGTESSMSIGDFEAFTPFSPQYLPKGFESSGLGGTTAPDYVRLELTYSYGEQFASVLQSIGLGTEKLPQGETLKINTVDGVFVPVFASSSQELQQKISSIPIVTNFDYGTTSLLAWHLGEVKIELVSNLPKEEILKIARSLAPAEIGPENFPVQK